MKPCPWSVTENIYLATATIADRPIASQSVEAAPKEVDRPVLGVKDEDISDRLADRPVAEERLVLRTRSKKPRLAAWRTDTIRDRFPCIAAVVALFFNSLPIQLGRIIQTRHQSVGCYPYCCQVIS